MFIKDESTVTELVTLVALKFNLDSSKVKIYTKKTNVDIWVADLVNTEENLLKFLD